MNDPMTAFKATVEAINDGEITVEEMHDAYTGSYGYVDADFRKLEYFALQVAELLRLTIERRDSH